MRRKMAFIRVQSTINKLNMYAIEWTVKISIVDTIQMTKCNSIQSKWKWKWKWTVIECKRIITTANAVSFEISRLRLRMYVGMDRNAIDS